MKPLLLKMQAFGPFNKQQELDFTLLGEKAFFLIHGPTGAGKSTLFDAMCFALYGQSSGTERRPDQMRSHHASSDTLTRVHFEFELHGKRYSVVREPEQMRKAVRGNREVRHPTQATLSVLSETDKSECTVIASGANDVTLKVQDLLRINHRQFVQVIMLPQGKFSDFLVATSVEKEAILKKLFGTELYERISLRFREQERAIATQFQNASQQRELLVQSLGLQGEAEIAPHQSKLAEQHQQKLEELGVLDRKLNTATDLHQRRNLCEQDIAAKTHQQQTLQAQLQTALVDLSQANIAQQEALALAPQVQLYNERVITLGALQGRVMAITEASQSALEARRQLDVAQATAKLAQENLDSFEATHEQQKASLQQLKDTAQSLPTLQAQQTLAQQNLRLLEDWQHCQAQLLSAKNTHNTTQEKEQIHHTALTKSQAKFDDARQHWRLGQSARLAQTLSAGMACPVCGATDHPTPALHESEVLVDDAALQKAEDDLATSNEQHVQAQLASTKADAHLSAAQTRYDHLAPQVAHLQTDQESLQAQIDTRELDITTANNAQTQAAALETELNNAQVQLQQLTVSNQAAQNAAQQKQSAFDQQSVLLAERQAQVPAEWQEAGALESAIESAQAELQRIAQIQTQAQTALLAKQEIQQNINGQLNQCTQQLQQAQAVLQAMPAELTLPELQQQVTQLTLERTECQQQYLHLGLEIAALNSVQEKLLAGKAAFEALEQQYQVTSSLARLCNNDNPRGTSFQRYVMAALLDDVLVATTRRLQVMSRGRYLMLRKEEAGPRNRTAGLDLEVLDNHTGRRRDVNTLSGGESFMAALSLALGLSDVVQSNAGGIRLDAIFIDEGFGSLDAESLDYAIQTLKGLQQSGRLVGIISHVPELRECVDASVEVISGMEGSVVRVLV
jgi:exonuclease SbcC